MDGGWWFMNSKLRELAYYLIELYSAILVFLIKYTLQYCNVNYILGSKI